MLRFKIFFFFCTLSGLKEENTGVGMRWYLSTTDITTKTVNKVLHIISVSVDFRTMTCPLKRETVRKAARGNAADPID